MSTDSDPTAVKDLKDQLDATVAKYNVVTRIVSAQDEYIKELELSRAQELKKAVKAPSPSSISRLKATSEDLVRDNGILRKFLEDHLPLPTDEEWNNLPETLGINSKKELRELWDNLGLKPASTLQRFLQNLSAAVTQLLQSRTKMKDEEIVKLCQENDQYLEELRTLKLSNVDAEEKVAKELMEKFTLRINKLDIERQKMIRENEKLKKKLEDAENGHSDRDQEKEREFNEKIRKLLHMNEEKEETFLHERKKLLDAVSRLEQQRTKRESIREEERQAREASLDKLLQLWEDKDRTERDHQDVLIKHIESVRSRENKREEVFDRTMDRLEETIERVTKVFIMSGGVTSGTVKLLEDKPAAAGGHSDVAKNAPHPGLFAESEVLMKEVASLRTEIDEKESQSEQRLAEEKQMLMHTRNLLKDVERMTSLDSRLQEAQALQARAQAETHRLRENALDRQKELTNMVTKSSKREAELRRILSNAVDAEELERENHFTNEAKLLDEVNALRLHVSNADQAHTESEKIMTKQLEDAEENIANLKSKLRNQREMFDTCLRNSEVSMSASASAAEKELTNLRSVVRSIASKFRNFRASAERERARLVTENEQLENNIQLLLENKSEREQALEAKVQSMKTEISSLRERLKEAEDVQQPQFQSIEDESSATGLHYIHPLKEVLLKWTERQESVAHAQETLAITIEQVKGEIAKKSKDLETKDGKEALMEELKLLRGAQENHEQQIQEKNALFEAERQRMEEERKALEESLALQISIVNSKGEALDETINAVDKIKTRMAEHEWERKQYLEKEAQARAEQRKAMELHTEIAATAAEEFKTNQAEELIKLRQLHKLDIKLAKESLEETQKGFMERIKGLLDRTHRDEIMIEELQNASREERKSILKKDAQTREELESLRHMLHTLRRVSTEKHIENAQEKKALLEEIEKLNKALIQKEADAEADDEKKGDDSDTQAILQHQVKLEEGEKKLLEEKLKKQSAIFEGELVKRENLINLLKRMEEERETQTANESNVIMAILEGLSGYCKRIDSIYEGDGKNESPEMEKLKELEQRHLEELTKVKDTFVAFRVGQNFDNDSTATVTKEN
eukprot:g4005.t1